MYQQFTLCQSVKTPCSRSKHIVVSILLTLICACGGSGSAVLSDNGIVSNDNDVFSEDPMQIPESVLVVRVNQDLETDVDARVDLSAEVRRDGMSIEPDALEWSQSSGPGAVVFDNPLQINTTATFSEAGRYTVQLLAISGDLTGSDTVHINVLEVTQNMPPIANAGADRQITLGDTLQLDGKVEDDGLPLAQLSASWRLQSGEGEVVFAETSDPKTSVTFSNAGRFKLELKADDGELTDADVMQVTVQGAEPEESVPEPPQNPGQIVDAGNNWQTLNSIDGSAPVARHEAGGVSFNGDFYLLGGRGFRDVSRYSVSEKKWENLNTPRKQMHHFQPVVYANKIYILGALDGKFPAETVVDQIQIYNPKNNTWSTGGRLPANRRRGSAGTVVYKNKIYLIGGSTNGHDGGTVNWFDEYDPVTNSWKTLPNAPTARDHFYAAVVGNRLVAAGGRQTDYPATFDNLVNRVDVYNFDTNQWEANAPNIPLARAGAMVVNVGPEIIVIGGETSTPGPASNRVDAYNVYTRQWRRFNSLRQSRHGGGAAVIGGQLHVASGNTRQGGGAETTHHEMLPLR